MARKPRDPESPQGLAGRADAAPPRGPPTEKQNPTGGGMLSLKATNNQRQETPHIGQEKSSKKGRGGKHFTYGQRVRMDTLIRMKWPRGKKVNFVELGRLMGKARSTVRREYARGEVANKDSQERWFNTYAAEAGRQDANARGQDKGPRMKLTNKAASRLETLVTGSDSRPTRPAPSWRRRGSGTSPASGASTTTPSRPASSGSRASRCPNRRLT